MSYSKVMLMQYYHNRKGYLRIVILLILLFVNPFIFMLVFEFMTWLKPKWICLKINHENKENDFI